jgi:hypothetical protein
MRVGGRLVEAAAHGRHGKKIMHRGGQGQSRTWQIVKECFNRSDVL